MNDFCILQIEDSAEDIILLRIAFKQAGITNPLQVVRDGKQAVDYLSGAGQYADRKKYPLPCLVLLDLKMPRKMGVDVLRWIREQPSLQTIPVLILTSSAQPGDIDGAYRAGANAFLVKPSGIKDLVEMLKAFKAFWLHFNHPPNEYVAEQELQTNVLT